MRLLATALLLLLVTGCASNNFTPYEGAQQNWPIAPGAMVDRHHAVPIYYGPPSRPYDVIGYVTVENAPGGRLFQNAGLGIAASEAQARGGHAIILQSSNRYQSGSVSTGYATGTGYYDRRTGYAHGQASGIGSTVPVMKSSASAIVIRFR